ncbi:SpoIIE family protein phosphatase [Pseudonocardia sp.]|uniref:ATP-binding SpoIIE family protein phosphatase n=1 Tax=Pseudonocardia sp. TaxID=60912 RepID=UPI0026096973|nr:SpoIIE family protein phosphatase [Pseudonocardia sp.]
MLPLHRAGAPVGYVAAHFAEEREFPVDERTLLEAVALQVENSLERVRLYELSIRLREVAERRAARQRVRSDVLERLNAADGPELRGRLLVEAVVPEIADLAVLVVPGGGGRPQRVAAAHADPALAPMLSRLPGPDVLDVLSTGSGVLAEQLAPDPDVPPALAAVSAITVPLLAGDSVVGALWVGFTDSGHRHRADDVPFVQDIATGAALAIENARLYEAEHRIAEVLQTNLLPQRLPQLPRLALGSRYLAGAAGTQAGGDWYDVLALDEHRAAVVVGDVVGNGPAAAAVMGQLRSALTCALLDGHGPAQVLEQLDRFAARIPGTRGSTAACVVVDWTRGELCWARAGHPPPMLLEDGRARLLDGSPGTVLGVCGRPPYTESRLAAGPGATVLLYTDGLVERRGEVIDDGMQRLADHAAGLGDRAPDTVLGDLLAHLVPAGRPSDDVAVVAARILPPPLRLRVPARPRQLRPVRAAVRAWAGQHALPAEVADDLLLAVGEAVANAVEHAYPDGAPGEVECTLHRAVDGPVQAVVRDTGTWRPAPTDNGHRGHGLAMIRALTADSELDGLPTGTTVRFRLPVATSPPRMYGHSDGEERSPE